MRWKPYLLGKRFSRKKNREIWRVDMPSTSWKFQYLPLHWILICDAMLCKEWSYWKTERRIRRHFTIFSLSCCCSDLAWLLLTWLEFLSLSEEIEFSSSFPTVFFAIDILSVSASILVSLLFYQSFAWKQAREDGHRTGQVGTVWLEYLLKYGQHMISFPTIRAV